MTYHSRNRPVTLDHHWMPFTATRDFRKDPRMVSGASGMHYSTPDGRRVLDMVAGLWCANIGHGRDEVGDAIRAQFSELDYAPSFNFGHPLSFELSDRLAAILPDGVDRIVYTGSGSEAVDTAIKVAYAFHHARGEAGRKRLIGRQRAYHGMGFGGLSVGGITPNRTAFGQWLPTDHLRSTHDPQRNVFSRGLPEHGGAEMADELEELLLFHDPSTVAAVMIEPISGAGGVLVPPQGYLSRLREICDRHGVLLIFDEVITGFGRTGSAFASQTFGVTPDILTMAKGLTSATVPMGAVACSGAVQEAILNAGPEGGIELFHGYTYAAHPLACAAALACLEIYEREGLFSRAAGPIGRSFEDVLHGFEDLPEVVDVRNFGLVGAIEFAAGDEKGARGTALLKAGWEEGMMIRSLGDAIAVSPPLIVEEADLEEFDAAFRRAVERVLP